MRILIVDQCSGSKSHPTGSVVLTQAEVDEFTREEAIERDGVAVKEARDLYSGRQQQLIDKATDRLRTESHDVDRYFISAGYGLVDESTPLPLYEVTFSDMSSEEIRHRSSALQIHEDLADVIQGETYDVIFLALGSDYYMALDLEELLTVPNANTITVLFNQEEVLEESENENVISLTARTPEARELGVIVVELKGKLIKNFADHLAQGVEVESIEDVRRFCRTETTRQSGLGNF